MDVERVSDTRVLHPDRRLSENSIRYPVTAPPEPPEGALHLTSIRDDPNTVAVSPVGAAGTLPVVVALAVLEGSLTPKLLIADTR